MMNDSNYKPPKTPSEDPEELSGFGPLWVIVIGLLLAILAVIVFLMTFDDGLTDDPDFRQEEMK